MPQRQSTSLLKPALAMIPLLVLGLIVGFAVPEPPPKSQTEPIATSNGSSAPDEPTPPTPPIPIDPQVNPNPRPVPNSWYTRNTGHQQDWIGKSWREIDLFQFLHRWPKDLDAGKHYVVFYSRTCEHCEAMFRDHFSHPLDAPVSAVEIPSSRTVLTGPGAWEMPPNICELLQLPLGCNWIITPPLALTIVDGKITCAIESEGFEQCLGLQ